MTCRAPASSEFLVVYDLRDGAARRRAHQHRALWGKRLTDYYVLDQNHVIFVFRSGGERWSRWEEKRREMILGEVQA